MKNLFSKFVFSRLNSSKQRGQASKDWQTIFRFLNQGDYEQVREGFQNLRKDSPAFEHGDAPLLWMAACLVSLACARFKTEGEALQQAFEQTTQSEQELRRHLLEYTQKLADRYPEAAVGLFSNWLTVAEHPLPAPPVSPLPSEAPDLQPPAEPEAQPCESERLLPVSTPPSACLELPAEGSALKIDSPEPETFLPTREYQPEFATSLSVFCLGKFLVYQDGQMVENFAAGKPRSVFKYLVANKEKPVAKEILMDIFWHDAPPESARRNLNWAIHNLRQVLHKNQPSLAHILFQHECYFLNPDLRLWTDVDEFCQHLRNATAFTDRREITLSIREYQAAEILYQGDYFEEDRYEDWLLPQRQHLQDEYLSLLEKLSRFQYDQQNFDECKRLCAKMLAADPCREEAHYRLMQCYYRQGYPYLAVRQYHLCVEKLRTELGVSPSPATTALSVDILAGRCQLPMISSALLQN